MGLTVKIQDMPEFHEQQRLAASNAQRAQRMAQQYGATLNSDEVLAQRLEAFIDFILPDDGDDDEITKARVRFELSWAQTIAASLDNAERVIREQTIAAGTPAAKPSSLIVPGR